MVDRAGFEPATFRFFSVVDANRTFFGPSPRSWVYQAELPALSLKEKLRAFREGLLGRSPKP